MRGGRRRGTDRRPGSRLQAAALGFMVSFRGDIARRYGRYTKQILTDSPSGAMEQLLAEAQPALALAHQNYDHGRVNRADKLSRAPEALRAPAFSSSQQQQQVRLAPAPQLYGARLDAQCLQHGAAKNGRVGVCSGSPGTDV